MTAKDDATKDQKQPGTDQEKAKTAPAKSTGKADWLIDEFSVRAKSPAGFWRCGVRFTRDTATRIFVVTDPAKVPEQHGCDEPHAYLDEASAQRVVDEPHLVVEE